MSRIERFEDLDAWKTAREITNDIYRLSQINDFSRDYGLRDQIRRAAISIMSNIAEGFERDGDKEFIQFLSVAKGSAGETRSQLYTALDQGYISEVDFRKLNGQVTEVSRMLSGLIKYLKQSDLKGRKFS